MRATIRTASAGRRLGFTLPDRSDDPPPAATSSGSERTRSCRGHPQARDPRRPRRDDGLPGRRGGARRHGRQPRTRLRLRRLGALAHERARRPRDGRGLPRRDARPAGRHAGGVGREPARGRPRGARVRAAADAPLQRALRRARPSRLAVRRPRPGLARAARPEPAPAPARHQHRRRLLASLPRDDRRGGGHARRPDQRRPAGRALGRASARRSRRSGWRACATGSRCR